jgi:peroxiredoxin Q/BCP
MCRVMSDRLEAGTKAPAFTAVAVGGEYGAGRSVSLADFVGRDLVLYFYPKDDTPGCTTQACGIRDGWGELSKRAAVFGVSIDSVKSHEKFIGKHELPFPLISDEDHALVEGFGVWVEKMLYGRRYLGTERTSFVIDGEGVIKAVFPKVKPAEHFKKLLEVLG